MELEEVLEKDPGPPRGNIPPWGGRFRVGQTPTNCLFLAGSRSMQSCV